MSSVDDLVAPTVASGTGLVNATALDAQLRTVVDRINALITAIGVAREATRNELADDSVRWRMFAEVTRSQIRHVVAHLRAVREALGVSILDPFTTGDAAAIAGLTTISTPSLPQSASLVAPGDAGVTYRTRVRFRAVMEACGATDGVIPAGAYFTPSSGSPSYPVPAWLRVDGRIRLATQAFSPAPDTFASAQLELTRAAGGFSRYLLNAETAAYQAGGLPVQQAAVDDGWSIDRTVELFPIAGDTLQFSYTPGSDASRFASLTTDTPPDDDPRFPYLARYRDALGIQLDLLEYRPVGINRLPTLLLDELGGWIETDGPGGFLEIE